jgi:ubiquinone/menaquinone biosynthesis C-methylase UbiE
MYSAVIISVVVLRYKKPDVKRYYKVPFGKIGPIILILIMLSLIVTWLTHEAGALRSLFLGILLISIGVPLYFLLEMYYDPRMIRIVNDLSAELNLLTERITLPISVRQEIIKLLGNIKGKTVLEFGCSVGTLTMHLAEEVGPKGKIYATDTSKRVLSITDKRLAKQGHKHVKTLHDYDHHKRLHPNVPKIHTVVSVGALGNLRDPEKTLEDMNKRLKIGSKICFVDYDKFFDIIPAVDWIENNDKIKAIFKAAGFDVKIERKQGFAWTYVYVYGKKVKNIK